MLTFVQSNFDNDVVSELSMLRVWHWLLKHHPIDVFEVWLFFRQCEVLRFRHAPPVILRDRRRLPMRLRLPNCHRFSISVLSRDPAFASLLALFHSARHHSEHVIDGRREAIAETPGH